MLPSAVVGRELRGGSRDGAFLSSPVLFVLFGALLLSCTAEPSPRLGIPLIRAAMASAHTPASSAPDLTASSVAPAPVLSQTAPPPSVSCRVVGAPLLACDTEPVGVGPSFGQGCHSAHAVLNKRSRRLERCFLSAWQSNDPPDQPQLFDLHFDRDWQLETVTAVGDTYGAAASCMMTEFAGEAAEGAGPAPPNVRISVGCWRVESPGILPLAMGCASDSDCTLERFEPTTSACCTCSFSAVLKSAKTELARRCRDEGSTCIQSCLPKPGIRAACTHGVCRVQP